MPKCNHKNLVPLEYTFGKVGFTKSPEPYDKVLTWDEYNLMSCHRMRVTAYYCCDCHAEIHIPTKIHKVEELKNEKPKEETRPSSNSSSGNSNPSQLRSALPKWKQKSDSTNRSK
jgi:hypothetical protein